MTRKTFEAARDCASKIKDLSPSEAQIKEMFSFLSMVDRLSEISDWECISHIMLEADGLPEKRTHERIFKEGVIMWKNGASTDEVSDHAADEYFKTDPAGYDAALCFAAVFSVAELLKGVRSYSFIDHALQYLLPDGWRWREEDEKDEKAHEGDENWHRRSHREIFLGDPQNELIHRFDDTKVCNLLSPKNPTAEAIGKRIADKLPNYKDGALQLIMKQLTCTELENALYALPEEAEDRIMSNLRPNCITEIKGDCILHKDSVSSIDIRLAAMRFEEAIDAYDGDFALEAGYDG